MHAIVRWGLRFRLLVIGSAVAVMVIGVAQLRNAPVDVLPEYSPPYVEVQTEALGLSAAEVEQFVTVPMEALMLSGVAWVETIRSESVPGLSSIVLVFEPGTDIMRARQMVQERLTQAHALPKVAKAPQMIQPLSSASRVMIVSLASASMSLTDLSVHARWTVRPRLLGVPGVANVSIWGQRERQLQVLVDPARLHGRGVTLDEIVRTTGNALWVSPLSYLKASTPGAPAAGAVAWARGQPRSRPSLTARPPAPDGDWRPRGWRRWRCRCSRSGRRSRRSVARGSS